MGATGPPGATGGAVAATALSASMGTLVTIDPGATLLIPFDTIAIAPTLGAYAGGTYTAGAAGLYSYTVDLALQTGGTTLLAAIYKNGPTGVTLGSAPTTATILTQANLGGLASLAAGDQLSVYISNLGPFVVSLLFGGGASQFNVIQLG